MRFARTLSLGLIGCVVLGGVIGCATQNNEGVVALKQENATLAAERDDLNVEMTSMESECMGLRDQLDKVTEALEHTEAVAETLQIAFTAAQEKLVQLKRQHTQRLSALTRQLSAARESEMNYKTKLADMQNRFNELRKHVQRTYSNTETRQAHNR
jgi:chromosome segregation ATPase